VSPALNVRTEKLVASEKFAAVQASANVTPSGCGLLTFKLLNVSVDYTQWMVEKSNVNRVTDETVNSDETVESVKNVNSTTEADVTEKVDTTQKADNDE